jgi:hypothetical protein
MFTAPKYDNTISNDDSDQNKNYGLYIGLLLVAILILIVLTVKNMLTINDLQAKINKDFTDQLSDLFNKNKNSNELITGLNKLVNENTVNFNKLLINNDVFSNKIIDLENKTAIKLKLIDIIKGSYSFDIEEKVKIYVDIYPASEYFKKYIDTVIVKNKYEYEYNDVETKLSDGTISKSSVPVRLKDNSLTIRGLKEKIKINSYKNDPILIIVTILDSNSKDPISNRNYNRVMQFYGLISQDINNPYVFEDINNSTIQVFTMNDIK